MVRGADWYGVRRRSRLSALVRRSLEPKPPIQPHQRLSAATLGLDTVIGGFIQIIGPALQPLACGSVEAGGIVHAVCAAGFDVIGNAIPYVAACSLLGEPRQAGVAQGVESVV